MAPRRLLLLALIFFVQFTLLQIKPIILKLILNCIPTILLEQNLFIYKLKKCDFFSLIGIRLIETFYNIFASFIWFVQLVNKMRDSFRIKIKMLQINSV